MKKIQLYFSIVFISFVTSCQKDKISVYSAGSGLTFAETKDIASDSLNYTFALNIVPKEIDTVYLPLMLTGWPSDQEREFKLAVDPISTAKEGVHFRFTKMVFPDNAVSFFYPVIVYKTKDMDNKIFQLKLNIADNGIFQTGASGSYVKVTEDEFPVGAKSYSTFKLNITSIVSKPGTWTSDVTHYFGTYSSERLLFMIQVLGINDFRTIPFGGKYIYADIINMYQKLNIALDAYEAEHGIRKVDENGHEISFN